MAGDGLPAPFEDFPDGLVVIAEPVIFEEFHLGAPHRRYLGEHPFPAGFRADEDMTFRQRHDPQPIDDQIELRAVRPFGVVPKLFNMKSFGTAIVATIIDLESFEASIVVIRGYPWLFVASRG